MNKNHNLIGPAGVLADLLAASLPAARNVKLLLCGDPGVGKSHLAQWLAAELCGEGGKWGVETTNGRHVSIHLIREWQRDVASSSLFGTGWKIKIVDEVDTCPADAQDALLSFLDTLPAQRGFICTSNLELGKLTPRFATRLQRHTVEAPAAEEIAALLVARGLPAAVAGQIAFLCGGCVRMALLDGEAWLNGAAVKAARARRIVSPQTSFAV